jgi:hypothetical protein
LLGCPIGRLARKSRVRSTRHTAALQAWGATRSLLGDVGGGERMRRKIEKTADHVEEDPQNKGELLEEAPEEYTEQQRAAWRRASGGYRAAAVDAPWSGKGGSFHEVGADVTACPRRARSEEKHRSVDRRRKRMANRKDEKGVGATSVASAAAGPFDEASRPSPGASHSKHEEGPEVDEAGRLRNAAVRHYDM